MNDITSKQIKIKQNTEPDGVLRDDTQVLSVATYASTHMQHTQTHREALTAGIQEDTWTPTFLGHYFQKSQFRGA